MTGFIVALMVCLAWSGFAVGLAVGRWQAQREAHRGPGARPMRLMTMSYTPPGLPAIPAATLSQWELYVVSFAFHGNMLGFSYRRMAGAGVCRRAAWETYTELLAGAGVVRGAERVASGWVGGWNYPALRSAIKSGRLALPFPAGDPPSLNSAHVAAQIAQHNTGSTGSTGGDHGQ